MGAVTLISRKNDKTSDKITPRSAGQAWIDLISNRSDSYAKENPFYPFHDRSPPLGFSKA